MSPGPRAWLPSVSATVLNNLAVPTDPKERKPDPTEAASPPAEGISQFMAKVLDQLSVSAWLPGAMLVGNLAVLIQLHRQHDLNVAEAIVALTKSAWGILIVILFAVVLATMVAQAFAFEGIRLLEGYWGGTRLTSWLIILRTRRHYNRLFRIDQRLDKYKERAFDVAAKAMLRANIKRTVIAVYENQILGRPQELDHSDADIEEALKLEWEMFCPPSWIRRIDALDSMASQYPEPHRILPTRLGNILRAAEDSLRKSSQTDLESFVLRNYDQLPAVLRTQHDQFRTRLDMYCILVFVFLALAALAPALLIQGSGGWFAILIAAPIYLLLSWISYQAAIASAGGYGDALRTIDRTLSSSPTGDNQP